MADDLGNEITSDELRRQAKKLENGANGDTDAMCRMLSYMGRMQASMFDNMVTHAQCEEKRKRRFDIRALALLSPVIVSFLGFMTLLIAKLF